MNNFFEQNFALRITNDCSDDQSSKSQKFIRYTSEVIQIKDERVLKDLTIIAYFDDPIIPYALKELINIPSNKNLLLLYEAALPSWTVILA